MKSWRGQLSFIGLATVAVALLAHGCQSPEAFHMNDDASSGTGGEDNGTGGNSNGTGGNGTGGSSNGTGGLGSGGLTGSGGFSTSTGGHVTIGTGGVGGRAAGSGGSALAGRNGTAGRGAGGRATATGGAGGKGTAGRAGTGGAGGRGGRSGAGGKSPFGFSDNSCVTDIQTNGYAYGTAPGCSACNDNGKSLEAQCQAVIDCLAPQWPCSGNCLTQCYNTAGASGPVMSCVSALTTAACGM